MRYPSAETSIRIHVYTAIVKIFESPCYHSQNVYCDRGICEKTMVITTWECVKSQLEFVSKIKPKFHCLVNAKNKNVCWENRIQIVLWKKQMYTVCG